MSGRGIGLSGASGASGAPRTLEQIERRRWHLWVVSGVLLLAVSLAVVVAFTAEGIDLGPVMDAPVLRFAFLGISIGFIAYVAEQERTFRQVTRELLAEHAHSSALEQRVDRLRTLVDAARTLNEALAPEEVFDVLLSSALDLTDGEAGQVALRVGSSLTTAVARGTLVPPAGHTELVAASDHREILEGAQPVAVTQYGPRHRVGAALTVGGRRVGVITVERTTAPFTPLEVSTVALFAEHAATAVANANRFEVERNRVESLADAAEQRADFVARLVHDLRAPLGAINGYAQLLRDRGDELESRQREAALSGIVEQGRRLSRLTDEVLRTVSTEAGAELARDELELASILKSAREQVEALAPAAGGPASITLAGVDDAGTICGDHDALHHVFTNLLENATKYAPGSPIDVEVVSRRDDVQVVVADHGPGIPPEARGEVFERFRQGRRSGSSGVGLGLYIVRTLVLAHGGAIRVDETPGGGATFVVTLPRTPHG